MRTLLKITMPAAAASRAMKSSSDMPVIAEPFFMQLDARVEFMPVMNLEDLKTGLGNIQKR